MFYLSKEYMYTWCNYHKKIPKPVTCAAIFSSCDINVYNVSSVSGMLDGWYDGCLGMLPSPDRLNTFNFTMAFTPNVKAALHWREGEDMGDKKNLTKRKIGKVN